MKLNFYNQIKQKQYQNFLILTLGIYFIGYWLFLHAAEYLPYVLDNNETYSSLVHAYNMYFGDWSKSFGLTDEAFSPDPAAHPMIHTHQGNWPRIYAFILFALGARTAESQIFIHVFTIGAISIWLLYRYFAKFINNKFAFIASIVFMTDYVLFAQWQVVTYRVWHCYFVFSCFNCMHEFDGTDKRWKILFFANYTALFYWELVFAFYLSAWSLIYYAFLTRWDFKRVVVRGIYIASCGLIGLCILFTQLTMFIGFKNAIMDYYLTFLGRNFAGDEVAFKNALKEFYENKNIAFFYNISNGNAYKNFKQFILGLFNYGFKIHTPILSLFVLIICAQILLKKIKQKFDARFNNSSSLSISNRKAIYIVSIPMIFLASILMMDNMFLGVGLNSQYFVSTGIMEQAAALFIGVGLTFVALNVAYPISGRILLSDVIFVYLFLTISILLIAMQVKVYQPNYENIWYAELTGNVSINLCRFVLLYLVVAGIINIISKVPHYDLALSKSALYHFMLAGLLAYIIVYILSPGYIYSGYLTRNAPFIVFTLDCLFAIGFTYIITEAVFQIRSIQVFKYLLAPTVPSFYYKNIFKLLPKIIFSCSGLIVLGVVFYQWLGNQCTYYKLFPADSLAFIKKLRMPDLKYKSVVTNQYSLPFAYETQSWAYTEGNLGAGEPILGQIGYYFPIEQEYLWYRNKQTFNDYNYPDYFVCFTPNSFDTVETELASGEARSRVCSSNRVVMHSNLIKSDLNHKTSKQKHIIVFSDESVKRRWDIIKLDWEFPPYLAKNPDTNKYFDIRIKNRILTINYIFKQQNNLLEDETKFKIYIKDSAGNKKLLSEQVGKGGKINVAMPNSKGSVEIIATPSTKGKIGTVVKEEFFYNL